MGAERTSSQVDSKGIWGPDRSLASGISDIRVPFLWKAKVQAREKQLRATSDSLSPTTKVNSRSGCKVERLGESSVSIEGG